MTLLYFLQSGPAVPSAGGGVPVVGAFLMIIPVVMVIIGMVMGFQALREIRLAEGRLGGAIPATLAAGLIPAAAIVFACGAGMVLLAEEMLPYPRSRSELWPTLGGLV